MQIKIHLEGRCRITHICLKTENEQDFLSKKFLLDMVFPQVIAVFHALIDAIGLPGNLLVIVTIILEKRFHAIRYILLASLAASDLLFLVLANSFRIASTAQGIWLYSETLCYLTVFHLTAVSYDRNKAIVKSPLRYDSAVSTTRAVLIVLIRVVPIPMSIGPLLGFGGRYVYNPAVFGCQHESTLHSGSSGRIAFSTIIVFGAPFIVIAFLNWSVYKAAKVQINTLEVQMGSLGGFEGQNREMSRRMRERKAAVDVSIIIAAFLLCFLPFWITVICVQFVKSVEVPVLLAPCLSVQRVTRSFMPSTKMTSESGLRRFSGGLDFVEVLMTSSIT